MPPFKPGQRSRLFGDEADSRPERETSASRNDMDGGRVYYIGIDPGASGGLAAIGGSGVVDLVSMPGTDRDVLDWLRLRALRGITPFALIEKVGGYVATGGGEAQAGQPGSAMFKFGASYGALKMALVAAGIPFEEVQPAVWQKGVGMSPRRKGEEKGVWKNRLKAHAQQLFPGEKVTLATADALLIAEWCRRKIEGRVGTR